MPKVYGQTLPVRVRKRGVPLRVDHRRVSVASDAIALVASSVRIDDPIVWATQRCVPLGLRRLVGLAARGRQNLHEQRRWSFNATGRNLRRLRDDDQIRLDDIVHRQDDIDGRVEHSPRPPASKNCSSWRCSRFETR